MRPILFELGSFPVHSFAVMMTAGFVVAGFLMRRDLVRKGEPPDLAWSIVAFGLVGGLLGSRLARALHEWPVFAAAPLAYLIGLQGMIWYGGLAGGVLATLWPIRRAGVAWASAVDSAAPALAGATRFLVEIVRTNESVFLGLTEAQWIGAALVAAGGGWLARLRR